MYEMFLQILRHLFNMIYGSRETVVCSKTYELCWQYVVLSWFDWDYDIHE